LSLLFSELKKMTVATYPTGQVLGTVSKTFLNSNKTCVKSLLCKKSFYEEGTLVDSSQIKSIGEDLIFTNSTFKKSTSRSKMNCIETDLIGKVVHDSKEKLYGVLANIQFDTKEFSVQKIIMTNLDTYSFEENSSLQVLDTKIIAKNFNPSKAPKGAKRKRTSAFSIPSLNSNFFDKVSDSIEKFTKKLEHTKTSRDEKE